MIDGWRCRKWELVVDSFGQRKEGRVGKCGRASIHGLVICEEAVNLTGETKSGVRVS